MSKILTGLNESTYRKYDNNRTGFSRGRRDDERHDLDVQRPTPQEWALKINGKVWSKDGKTVTFTSKEKALKARESLLARRPELEVGLVTRGGVAEAGTGLDIDRSIPGRTIARISGDIKHRTGSPSGKKLPDYHPNDDYLNVCTLNTVHRQLNNNSISNSAREIYKAAEQYHLYLTDPYFNQFVQDQLIKEITLLSQQHNKRLIIIPAFRSGIPYQTIFQDPLYDITRKEIYTNFKDTIYRYENVDRRANHLSKENNEQLASLVNKLINNNLEKITLDDFIFTKYDSPEVYWEI
jgi:hypothetical protein